MKGHIGAECRSGKKCSSCGGKHHISICYRNRRTDQSTANQSEPTPQESSSLNPSAPSYKPESTATMCTSGKDAVLLQITEAVVVNPHDETRNMKVQVILDSGSQLW